MQHAYKLTTKIGFIGAGNLAESLIKGFLSVGNITAKNILASAPTERDVYNVKNLGCQTTLSNIDVLKENETIALLVKPQILGLVLDEIAPYVTRDHLILSFAAGSQISTMENILPQRSRIARVMTNLAVQFCEGTSSFSLGRYCDKGDKQTVKSLLDQVGISNEVSEDLMDTVAGFTGAGPAYGYYVIESLADGAVLCGMNRDDAIKMAAKTLLGAAKMVECTNKHPAQLKDNVCSAGGVTIQGIYTLEKRATKAAFINAVESATIRSKELGAQINETVLKSVAEKHAIVEKRPKKAAVN